MTLKPRERLIIELTAAGVPSKMIGEHVKITEKAVNNARIRLIKKFNCVNTPHLIAELFRRKMLN